MNVYWGMRNLTEVLRAFTSGSESEARDSHDDDLQFTDRVEVLERATHSLWYSDIKDPKTLIFRLLGSATLIYIYTVLRMLPAQLRILKLVAMRMKDQMERAQDLNVVLATFPELMLWVLFLAGQASEVERRPFFARQASKILIMMKIEKEDEIVRASQDFLWPERNDIIEEFDSQEDEEMMNNASVPSSSTAMSESS